MKPGQFYGKLFRFSRFCMHWFFPIEETPAREIGCEPCVFICRHKDLQGPVYTMLWLKTPVHAWVLDVFHTREQCVRQYRDYTFSVRFHWNKCFVKVAANVCGWFVPRLMRSMRAIPVYRRSARLITTYRETLKVLLAGESVIIYPDIDYESKSDAVEALYQGYLLLEKLYRKACGRALNFVPLYVDAPGRRILSGLPINFRGDDYAAEVDRVAQAIHDELTRLAGLLAQSDGA